MPASKKSVLFLGIALALAALAVRAAAYDHPLDSNTIRDAYFLGADPQQSAQFLSRYIKDLPAPSRPGAYVSQFEVRTPFAQVVVNSREHSVGYSALQAETDYRKNPGAVLVRVQILFGNALGAGDALQPPAACQGVNRMNSALDCFHDFRFRIEQGQGQIQPRESYGVPVFSIGDNAILIGGDVWFNLSEKDVASAPLRVTATDASGHAFSASFDLAALR